MIITATNNEDALKFARFTWSDDLENCDHVAAGVTDEEFDALLEAKVHEGANLAGWTVTVR